MSMLKRSRFFVPVLLFILCQSSLALVDDRSITIASMRDVTSVRESLIAYIWGNKGFPATKLPELPVIRNDKSPISGLADLERVDTLTVNVDRGMLTYAHHFIPKIKNGRVVILHQGHFTTFEDSPLPADISFGLRRTIEGLLGDGYSVLAVYMPKFASFQTTIDVEEDPFELIHNQFFTHEKYLPTYGSPFRYFVEPVAAFVNYLETRSDVDGFPHYSGIDMVGFSGGGWTTTLYAAIDPRIEISISVAGTQPLYLRPEDAAGDTEQIFDDFYSLAGYPDLYVLGASGSGRRQVQVLNRNDWCCFGEKQHDPKRDEGFDWTNSVRRYESRVREALLSIGDSDLFSVEIDEASTGHMITWDTIYDTILPELNRGKRQIGSSTGSDAAAKGVSGTPMFLLNDSWRPARLPSIYGTPAILTGAVNINDMFYRNANSELIYVSRPPAIWSRAQVLDTHMISDPAAISGSAGTLDVVAFRNDYFPYHYHWDGSHWTTSQINDYIKGVGAPILLSSAPGQLDLFYRSWNRRLYHAVKFPDSGWLFSDLGGRMQDLPTAVVMPDGSIRAYIRGVDSRLYEIVRSPGKFGKWSAWDPIVTGDEMPLLGGSPSATVVDGKVAVFVRSSNGHLLKFRYDSEAGWQMTDAGGFVIGSPTATPRGAYSRGIEGNLQLLRDGKWLDFGGRLD